MGMTSQETEEGNAVAITLGYSGPAATRLFGSRNRVIGQCYVDIGDV
jgi:hypothetical protein